jgi:hypothetical protein
VAQRFLAVSSRPWRYGMVCHDLSPRRGSGRFVCACKNLCVPATWLPAPDAQTVRRRILVLAVIFVFVALVMVGGFLSAALGSRSNPYNSGQVKASFALSHVRLEPANTLGQYELSFRITAKETSNANCSVLVVASRLRVPLAATVLQAGVPTIENETITGMGHIQGVRDIVLSCTGLVVP